MSRLLTAFYDTPWAIIPDRLPVIRDVLHRWDAGTKLSPAEIQAAVGDAPQAAHRRRSQTGPSGIGVLPILGILAQRRAGDVSSPGTATDTAAREFRAMMNDPAIETIVFDIDSPGGSVFGIQAFADEILASRGIKRTVAVANSLAASAAYWIGSAADEFVVSPGGEVGSIGVIAAHEDRSGKLEQEGVNVTIVSAGKFKSEGHPFGPLSNEAKAAMKGRIDEYYNDFVSAVAHHRGVASPVVTGGFGEGRVVGAREALSIGMVDRIETFDNTISRLRQRPATQSRAAGATVNRRRLALIDLEG